MPKSKPMFYSALMLTGVNLLLRLAGTSFQVYISAKIGPAGVGLLQLTMSVGNIAIIAGIGGIRTASMYLTAEELGRKRPGSVPWVLSKCFLYSILCSGAVALLLFSIAPYIAGSWIGESRVAAALRILAAFLPVTGLCAVMTGYFTAAGRIGTLAAVEVAEQIFTMSVTLLALSFFAGRDAGRACQCILLGSGLTAQNARELLAHADGAIVGSYFKAGGNWKNAVDPQRTRAFIREVEALRREGA